MNTHCVSKTSIECRSATSHYALLSSFADSTASKLWNGNLVTCYFKPYLLLSIFKSPKSAYLLSCPNSRIVPFIESFIDMHLSALLAVGKLIGMASAAYSLVDDISGNNFFDVFHFETVGN